MEKPVYRPGTNDRITDIDILTRNAAIEVKGQKTVKGLKGQLTDSYPEALAVEGMSEHVPIGSAPNTDSSLKNIMSEGALVTKDLDTLLEVIRP